MGIRGSLCALVLFAACDPPPPLLDAAPGELERVATFPAAPRPLDLMLVIDDSGSMTDKQAALASTFPGLVAKLASFDGGLPDLQIAVVSTDMGTSAREEAEPGPMVGALGNGGCASRGKDGAFIVQPDVLRTTTTVNFLKHPRGGEPNYNGTLESALSTQVKLGARGCGFEQPLAATRAALMSSMNQGFVRPEASLAVVILSDEDDCSARRTALFSPDSTELGALQSFRCFRFGVECSPDNVNEEGAKSACRPRQAADSLVADIAPYRDAIMAAKGDDARKVMLGAIVAPANAIAVELRAPPGGGPAQPNIARACSFTNALGESAVADPAVRIAALVDDFPGLHVRETICSQDLAPAATSIGLELERLVVGDRCLLRTIDPNENCSVIDETGDEEPVAIAECGGGATTCYAITADAACGSGLRLDVARTQPAPPNTFTTLRCAGQ